MAKGKNPQNKKKQKRQSSKPRKPSSETKAARSAAAKKGWDKRGRKPKGYTPGKTPESRSLLNDLTQARREASTMSNRRFAAKSVKSGYPEPDATNVPRTYVESTFQGGKPVGGGDRTATSDKASLTLKKYEELIEDLHGPNPIASLRASQDINDPDFRNKALSELAIVESQFPTEVQAIGQQLGLKEYESSDHDLSVGVKSVPKDPPANSLDPVYQTDPKTGGRVLVRDAETNLAPFIENDPLDTALNLYNVYMQDPANRMSMDPASIKAEKAAKQAARDAAALHNGVGPTAEQIISRGQIASGRVVDRLKTAGTDDLQKVVGATRAYEDKRGTGPFGQKHPLTKDVIVPGKVVREHSDAAIFSALSDNEQQDLRRLADDPSSVFHGAFKTSGALGGSSIEASANLSKLLQARALGYSLNESLDWVKSGGRLAPATKPNISNPFETLDETGKLGMQDMLKSRNQNFSYLAGASNKEGDVGEMEDFEWGKQQQSAPSLEELKKAFPNLSEGHLMQLYLEGKEQVSQQNFKQNYRFSHEQRDARLSGNRSNHAEPGDRVTLFTTNLGAPTVSAPSNSLLGQYVVKKRKAMVLKDKTATRQELKGEFPQAVRDRHLFEVSTGLGVGIQGRYGVFQQFGYKTPKKSSKGYNRSVPLGATVMRDNAGNPVYDAQGNVRFTEGYTSRFSSGTNQLGLKVFIG